jgi:hypothetical protein
MSIPVGRHARSTRDGGENVRVPRLFSPSHSATFLVLTAPKRWTVLTAPTTIARYEEVANSIMGAAAEMRNSRTH